VSVSGTELRHPGIVDGGWRACVAVSDTELRHPGIVAAGGGSRAGKMSGAHHAEIVKRRGRNADPRDTGR
jgi:hypothetical protein